MSFGVVRPVVRVMLTVGRRPGLSTANSGMRRNSLFVFVYKEVVLKRLLSFVGRSSSRVLGRIRRSGCSRTSAARSTVASVRTVGLRLSEVLVFLFQLINALEDLRLVLYSRLHTSHLVVLVVFSALRCSILLPRRHKRILRSVA